MDELKTVLVNKGTDKNGNKEDRDIIFESGKTYSIVGPTGSGKTALVTDIEMLAQGDTATGRWVFVNGEEPCDLMRRDPSQKPVAMITQNTKCFTDMSVADFIDTHKKARGSEYLTAGVILLANKFTGEKIYSDDRVTHLSGGQTRSLMIADALLIGSAPVLILDEIENAGINRAEVIKAIKATSKIAIFVTHDPAIMLMTDYRIVMENGGIRKVIKSGSMDGIVLAELMEGYNAIELAKEYLRGGGEYVENFNYCGSSISGEDCTCKAGAQEQ